jgi:catechol 2,3-dioxygenase-like lactoylglutathione lyase family enzyme
MEINLASIMVADQDKALKFYTDALGSSNRRSSMTRAGTCFRFIKADHDHSRLTPASSSSRAIGIHSQQLAP